MLITITGKHIEITDAIRSHAEDKVSKLSKYYDNVNKVEVIIDGSVSTNLSVEVLARTEHGKVFISTEKGAELYSCIDMAVHKVEGQLRKAKGINRDNKFKSGVEPE